MSMGPDKIHLQVPRKLEEEVAKPPSIVFEFPLMKNGNHNLHFRKGRKADLGN